MPVPLSRVSIERAKGAQSSAKDSQSSGTFSDCLGKIRDLSFVSSGDAEPFDDDVAEDTALKNALASDPVKMPLGTVNEMSLRLG